MSQTPCEYIVWNVLPIIRKEIALIMINDYGLSKTETAKKLGISQAAISQYLSGKRAKMNVINKQILKEINRSTKKIIQLGDEVLVSETCKLCKIISTKNLFPLINKGDDREIL